MRLKSVVSVVVASVVAACMDPVRDIKPWSPELASQASVEAVAISFRGVKANEHLQTLKSALEQQTSACARGSKRYDLQVLVDQYEFGGSDKISATVKVVEPGAQAPAAEYYIQEVRGGVGIVGIVNAQNRGADNARDFAKSVCRRIFYAR
jgi:hypothetical protein